MLRSQNAVPVVLGGLLLSSELSSHGYQHSVSKNLLISDVYVSLPI